MRHVCHIRLRRKKIWRADDAYVGLDGWPKTQGVRSEACWNVYPREPGAVRARGSRWSASVAWLSPERRRRRPVTLYGDSQRPRMHYVNGLNGVVVSGRQRCRSSAATRQPASHVQQHRCCQRAPVVTRTRGQLQEHDGRIKNGVRTTRWQRSRRSTARRADQGGRDSAHAGARAVGDKLGAYGY